MIRQRRIIGDFCWFQIRWHCMMTRVTRGRYITEIWAELNVYMQTIDHRRLVDGFINGSTTLRSVYTTIFRTTRKTIRSGDWWLLDILFPYFAPNVTRFIKWFQMTTPRKLLTACDESVTKTKAVMKCCYMWTCRWLLFNASEVMRGCTTRSTDNWNIA